MSSIGPSVGVTPPSYVGQASGVLIPSTWTLLSKTVANTATATVTTSAINTTGANLIVVCSAYQVAPPVTISDSASNTWSTAIQAGTAYFGTISYVSNPATSATHTFTGSIAGSNNIAVAVLAYSGAAATLPLDKTNSGNFPTTAVTVFHPGSITPVTANQLLITSATLYPNGSTFTVSNSFTVQEFLDGVSGATYGLGVASLVQAVAAAINPACTFGVAVNGVNLIASFKPAVP